MAAADLALDDARLGRADDERRRSPWAWSPRPDPAAASSASANCSSCGARARASSARTSPSPGSTRPAPARSPSAAASRAPAVWSPATRPGGLDAVAHAARAIRRGTDAIVVGRGRGAARPVLGGLPARLPGAEHGRRPVARLPPVHRRRLRIRARRGRRHARRRGRGGGPRARGAGPGRGRRARGDLHRRLPLGAVPRGARARRSAAPWTRPAAPRRRSTWSSRTPSASRRRTGPRRWRIADALGAHGSAGSRSPRPRPASAAAYCGAPVLDAAAAVLAMEHGLVPPTPNVVRRLPRPRPGDRPDARPAELRTALVLSRGLMGSNSALVLRHGAAAARSAGDPTRRRRSTT